MNRVAVTAVAALAIAASVFLSRAIAQSPANVPLNVRVNNMAAGTGRGTTTFALEWDQAKNLTTNAPITTYEIGKKCAYTYTGSDKAIGGNSGLTLMSGPGPHYKVMATCNCDRGYLAWAMVRVYSATWVGPTNLPPSLMKTPLSFLGTCSPVQ